MGGYKLISSREFGKTLKNVSDSEYRRLRDNYDLLLKQPLKLEMFVCCDDEGNFLEEIDGADFEYYQAKEKVLFEGFEVKNEKYRKPYIGFEDSTIIFYKLENWELQSSLSTIEDLIRLSPKLTPSALKQIGL